MCVCSVKAVHSYHHIDAVFLQWRFIVRDVTDANHCGGAVVLQILKRKNNIACEDAEIVA